MPALALLIAVSTAASGAASGPVTAAPIVSPDSAAPAAPAGADRPGPVAPGTTAVLALGDDASSARAAAALATRLSVAGASVLTPKQLAQRLTGTPEPRNADAGSLASLLQEAREREAYFDQAGAETLRRQVTSAFDAALRPEAALRKAAAEATRDRAAAAFVEGDRAGASELAREVWRRFGHIPIDSTRQSPAIADFLSSERAAAEATARVPVAVTSDRPGTLYADGVVLGRSEGQLATSLPAGTYRVWLDYGAGWSLPHPIVVGAPRTELHIDTDLDSRTLLGDTVALRCTTSCKSDLADLAARLGVERVYGVRGGNGGAGEVVAFDALRGEGRTGTFSERRGLELDPPTVPSGYPRWSALYLVPFGGGQLAQHRALVGAIYAAAELGLLGWHVASRVRFADTRDVVRQEDIRQQANLSLGLLVGALAASVVEAVVVGQLAGE